ncbi:hypothetical protein ACIP9H_33975 [Streptomyces sp. NPDC088732]|uniref:hypothetical protein n=1 Tax=Streptomyces sp. NPDC088732 TaxID=3365879 RepID=UPI0038084CC9
MGTSDNEYRDYDRRAGAVLVNLYNHSKAGGAHAGETVTAPYQDLLDAAEATFRSGMESGDVEKAVQGWNELTEVTAHIAHANARIGTLLLATAVNYLEETPENLIEQVYVELEKNRS